MEISDQQIAHMLELLSRDVACTKAARYRDATPSTAQEVRDWYDGLSFENIESLTEKVVGDVQQGLMDTYVDTTWPACPRHSNHPLWFRDDSWYCERDGVALAQLGGLPEILPPLPPEPSHVPGPFVRRPRKGSASS
ncbi:MAG: hypothetical protein JWO39_272 [Gemmatimonadetes bacterium]|nr:hypothetical protein [Gemmatimonadota bacterium]